MNIPVSGQAERLFFQQIKSLANGWQCRELLVGIIGHDEGEISGDESAQLGFAADAGNVDAASSAAVFINPLQLHNMGGGSERGRLPAGITPGGVAMGDDEVAGGLELVPDAPAA